MSYRWAIRPWSFLNDSELVLLDHALDQRDRGEPGPLLVLREVVELEALEEHAQMRLDRVDAQVHLVRDRLVGRGRGIRGILEWTAQRDQNLALAFAEQHVAAA